MHNIVETAKHSRPRILQKCGIYLLNKRIILKKKNKNNKNKQTIKKHTSIHLKEESFYLHKFQMLAR